MEKQGPIIKPDLLKSLVIFTDVEVLSYIESETERRGVKRELVVNEIIKELVSKNKHKESVEKLMENPMGAIK